MKEEEETEDVQYDVVTCRHCDGAGCLYCGKTGKVEVRHPARLCPKCNGECCIYCGYTGWDKPRGKYE